jgi:hypothetical protein
VVLGAVAGCSQHLASQSVTRASCHAQYDTWKTGPAKAVATSMVDHLTSLDFSGAVPDARRLESMPMPSCADPAGYWRQLLARVVAIGSNEQLGLGYLITRPRRSRPWRPSWAPS